MSERVPLFCLEAQIYDKMHGFHAQAQSIKQGKEIAILLIKRKD